MSRYGFVSRAALALSFSLTCVSASRGDDGERTSTVADRRAVYVTAYNGGLSLIHDRRRLVLPAGTARVAWRDVAAKIDATSAIIESLTAPSALTVLEQNFNYDLLSPAALLGKYVGSEVTVVHDSAPPGAPRRETARLLAVNDGVVLQYRDRIETGIDGHIVYHGLPANLRDRPTLVLDLQSQRSGAQDVDLSYLTGGLDWNADYIGNVAPDERSMTLSGLVTLKNESGTSYRGAHLQLVAGNVHVAPSSSMQPMTSVDAVATPSVQESSFFEYHLYTIARPTDVDENQTKQITLLVARSVPIHKTLELRGSSIYYQSATSDLGNKLKVGVYETFVNRGGDLGIPLPAGTVRLYKKSPQGSSLFIGSDAIEHTPRNEEVRLHLGDSFDVTANKKQIDFEGTHDCTFLSRYEIRVANAKNEPVDVEVVEPIPGTWSILEESLPHRKTSSATATWTVHVPKDSSTTLRYRAKVDLCF